MPTAKIGYDAGVRWRTVRLPGSKSIAARALICRYVNGLDTELVNLPECDDTRELSAALKELDGHVHAPLVRLREFGELPPAELNVNLGNGGTSLRFFVALVASLPDVAARVDCGEGLRHRPLSPLVDELRRHGADIEYLHEEGYAPLFIRGRRLRGGDIRVSGTSSSQFVSAIMMAMPLWEILDGVELPADIVSRPYVDMTQKVMDSFASAPDRYVVESDWSAASYFYELALAAPGRCLRIESLTRPENSIQGDAKCCGLFGWLGVRSEWESDDVHGAAILWCDPEELRIMRCTGADVEFDLNDTPDLVPALAAGMCLARLPFVLQGIGHLRHKESDRLLSVSMELEKAGYAVRAEEDSLVWNGGRCPVSEDETHDSWNDHRIAMSMAMMAVRGGRIAIERSEVVAKSFPGFYKELAKVGFKIRT